MHSKKIVDILRYYILEKKRQNSQNIKNRLVRADLFVLIQLYIFLIFVNIIVWQQNVFYFFEYNQILGLKLTKNFNLILFLVILLTKY